MNGKGNKRSRNRNYKNSRDRREEKFDKKTDVKEEQEVSGKVNDAAYYFSDETLKRQLASISFNQYGGTAADLGLFKDSPYYLMAIYLNPAASYNDGMNISGMDMAALSNYTNLSANNAKTSNYAPQDVSMLYLSVGQLIAMVSHVTRVLGCVRVFNYRNRSMPKLLVEGLNVDYDDLVANLADYRVQLNTLIVEISKIPIPANVPYFQKCMDIYSGIYMDMEGSNMAQLYAFVPNSTWQLSETYSEQGSGLQTLPCAHNGLDGTLKFSYYLNVIKSMAYALLTSTTLNAIYSDILRLATKDGLPLLSFQTVPEDYTVLPAYVPEIRVWINNLTVMPGEPNGTTNTATTTKDNDVLSSNDTNGIQYMPQWTSVSNYQAIGIDTYINFDYSNPTDDDIIYATRLKPRAKVDFSGTTPKIVSCTLPDHYPTGIRMFRGDGTSEQFLGYAGTNNIGGLAIAFSSFDWHPAVYVNNGNTWYGTMFDLNWYTVVDYEYLQRVNDASYQGLFEMR